LGTIVGQHSVDLVGSRFEEGIQKVGGDAVVAFGCRSVEANLPPKCPELNPVENVWQFIRDNWLSNRVFRSYGDILEHCCFAWNRLIDQPWTIMSIGLRDWAQRF
jgi:hypothetical protein